MPSSPPSVGKDVDSWCTRCKLILAHTIEAVSGGRITRVHCNTCGGQHAYRASVPGTSKSGAAKRSRTGRPTAAHPADHATLLRGRDPSTARHYSPSDRFAEGDLIQHDTFGVGVVTARKDVNKIEVSFADGAKVLLHRKGP
ncbi:MAG: hypothetical protein AB7V27_11480 [Candidatus Binatia bacterium]